MESFEDTLRLYDYALPHERIATKPASPRDSAKLVVFDRATGRTTWTTFRKIADHLPPRSLLVLNETKVIPARLRLRRETGGTIAVLYLGTEKGMMYVLSPKKLKVGERLRLRGKDVCVVERTSKADIPSHVVPIPRTAGAVHLGNKNSAAPVPGCGTIGEGIAPSSMNIWLLRPLFPIRRLDHLLRRHGETPIPPYIKHSPLSERTLRSSYQTIFAKTPGSIAAPTASLHFTKRLMRELKKRGIDVVKVTLHVHLGTFAPLSAEQWKRGKLHAEAYAIDPTTARLIERAKREGRSIVAVGTTVARTLESAAGAPGRLRHVQGTTDLFIRDGHRFRIVDSLITNFHVPKSSLLILVCAFDGRQRIFDIYRQAIDRKLRFFSFGDAMLIL